MKRRNFWIIRGVLLFLIIVILLFLYGQLSNHMKNERQKNNLETDTFTSNNHTIEEDSLDIDRISSHENLINELQVEIKETEMVDNYKTKTENKEEIIRDIKEMKAGRVVDTKDLPEDILRSLFYYTGISEEIKSRIKGISYPLDAAIALEELVYIRILHKGFDAEHYVGEIIMNRAVAEDIVEIFWELYQIDYPIEKMVLVDEYGADDDISMAANNSSAFNYRNIAGTNRLSLHSQGLAIDINPLYNPYITTINGSKAILPENGAMYEYRELQNPYYIRKDDELYKAFTNRGFTWGGDWVNSKDYQHFQKVIQ